jgi:hypothetical protein
MSGPASIVAWGFDALLALPLALTFARLADLVSADPDPQRFLVAVEQHMEDVEADRGHAAGQLGPVRLRKHCLGRYEVRPVAESQPRGDLWHERAPRREILEVTQLIGAQVRPQHVADGLRIEEAPTWLRVGLPSRWWSSRPRTRR